MIFLCVGVQMICCRICTIVHVYIHQCKQMSKYIGVERFVDCEKQNMINIIIHCNFLVFDFKKELVSKKCFACSLIINMNFINHIKSFFPA